MRGRIFLFGMLLFHIPLVLAADSEIVPEFSTITAGIALMGGVIGYALLKKRRGGKK